MNFIFYLNIWPTQTGSLKLALTLSVAYIHFQMSFDSILIDNLDHIIKAGDLYLHAFPNFYTIIPP